MSENCAHYWIPNSGRGGEPQFKVNRQLSNKPTMHVKCSLCGARTWFTEAQYLAIPASEEPGASAA